jgi:thiamine-monophosphate kinase
MMDVSDGLLIDLQRLCVASGCGAKVDLDALPLSPAFAAARGEDRAARLFAATGGDDYALLAALPPAVTLSLPGPAIVTCIGALVPGSSSLSLSDASGSVPLPEHLGHEHRTS